MSESNRIQQAFADLDKGDATAQLAAIQTLGEFQVRDAVSDLVRLLPDETLGDAAARALLEISIAAVRDDVELLEQPDFNAATVVSLNADDQVKLLRFSEEREWVYVRTTDGIEGWIWSALLSTRVPKMGAKPDLRDLLEAEEQDEGRSRGISDDLLKELEEASTVEPSPVVPGATVPRPAPSEAPQTAQAVQFSAYYPKEVPTNVWLALRAYVYQITAAPQVLDDAKQQLGDAVDDYRRTVEAARSDIQEGALVTATPELPGFQFNPPSLSLLFLEEWHRFDFKLRATTAPPEQAANGRITFTVEGVIVADIPMSIFVSPTATTPGSNPSGGGTPTLPASVASTTSKPYQAIFCSYSHRDTQIVERVEKAYKALGLDFLRDITTLKSGQDWNAELLNMIDRADIFQLFWSANSAQSKYVRQEWERALQRAGGREAFIRPVYWEQPMPNVPTELGHIHFAFQPELDD